MRQEEENLEAAQALVSNIQERRTFGFGVISGGGITINTGTLGGADTLSVAATDVLVGGTEYNLTSDTVGISASNTDPRRDVVYVDNTGSLQVGEGTPAEAISPVGADEYIDHRSPVPEDLKDVDATVLAEIWVPANASALSANEIIDRRTDADIEAQIITAAEIIADQFGTVNADSVTVTGATQTNSLDVTTTTTTDDVDANTGTIDDLSAVDATVSNSPTDDTDVAIKSYVDSVAQGLNWQEPVIDELNDPPVSPSIGDRYLIDDAPTGDWVGHPNEITEWDGSQWVFFTPSEGWAVFIEDIDLLKVYQAGDWVAFGSAIDHGNLAGLNDDDHTQYLLVDGTRAMSGGLDMGANAISNASTVDSGAYTVGGSTIAQSVVASGQVALTSGEATVNTGISAVDATFTLALGVDDPNADVDLSGRLFWDDSAGTYKIDIVEATTNVGNPTANYDVVRVR